VIYYKQRKKTRLQKEAKMKFHRVRSGEYCTKVRDGVYLLVERKHHQWWWCLCGSDNGNWWETDDQGTFPTLQAAMADAIASYEDFLD
jgi:hypothetical protein